MNLYKIFLLTIVVFYNISCDGYYENGKNPFKASDVCENDRYSYNKQDLVNESFGKIGVVSNTQEYPRAGIDNLEYYRDNQAVKINGRFNSLCQSSIIDKIKIELHNGKNQIKTYYPSIDIGYSGTFNQYINFNQNDNDRCFFKDAKISLKTWARDEDGNTYYANNYSSTRNINVKSDISWDDKYEYGYRVEYKNDTTETNTTHIIEYKYEDKEVDDINYTFKYKYDYVYKYDYSDRYRYKFPTKMIIYADDSYKGNYIKMSVRIHFVSNEDYLILNTNRQVSFNIGGNSIKRGSTHIIEASLMEQLNGCSIQSKAIKKTINIPIELLDETKLHYLRNTTKVLISKTYYSKVRKD